MLPAPPMSAPSNVVDVVIPTFNSSGRISRVLRALLEQEGPDFDIVVVDNSSTDGTVRVIEAEAAARQRPGTRILVLSETRRGAQYARERGAEHSRAQWIAFLDDDNIPLQGWILAAVRTAQEVGGIRAFHGRNLAPEQVLKHPNFRCMKSLLAIHDRGADSFTYSGPPGSSYAPTAGLVVNREMFLNRCLGRQILMGPTAMRPLVAEDMELCMRLLKDGGLHYDSEMTLLHEVEVERLESSRVLRAHRVSGESAHVPRMLKYSPCWRLPVLALAILRDAAKLLTLLSGLGPKGLYRRCLLQYHLGSLASPWIAAGLMGQDPRFSRLGRLSRLLCLTD